MKKLMLSLVIASSLGLTACDDETIKDVNEKVAAQQPQVTPSARIVFDPSVGDLSVPNDLLFQGTTDGTLNLPITQPVVASDPYLALSALDGWSTANPFVLNIEFPDGRSLDSTSVSNPDSLRIFEAKMGGDTTDADCAAVKRGLACKVVAELNYAQDFITQKSGNSVAVVPLKPLKAKTTYLVALTDSLQDNTGKAVAGSSTYELVQQDINTHPLGSEAQLGLQAVINSFEHAVSGAGVNKASIIYTFALTTQSTTDVLFTNKALMAANAQQGIVPSITVTDTGASVADILAGKIPENLVPLYSAANFMQGKITLPYYLGTPTETNPLAPLNQWWKSLCDSGVMLAGLAAQNPTAIPAEPVSETDAKCMAISQANGLPAPGLRDLGIDTERHLTKFSPVAKANAMLPIDVQITTPDLAVVNDVRSSMGLPALTAPENGWPIAILQHGITSKKEDMLSLTGILSVYGLATAAINLPLHGEPELGGRGFVVTYEKEGEAITTTINATTNAATDYMNLASLLTTRDNIRQSVSDMVGLRFGLNFLMGNDIEGNAIKIDSSKVHLLGNSLGAIVGINFMAIVNTSLNPAIDDKFKVNTNFLATPGFMMVNLLMESAAFGDVIKANLTYAQSEDFKAYVDTSYPTGASQAELIATYKGFYASLNASQQAALNSAFQKFTFAAQTVTDAADPVNYSAIFKATNTPTHVMEMVGNGADNLSDQVIPNRVSTTPLGGTEGAIALLGLPSVSSTVESADGVSGVVRFVAGHHSSLLTPAADSATSPDVELSARANKEIQFQVANFFSANGEVIKVNDTEVVQ